MAFTGTSALGDSIPAEVVESMIRELRPAMTSREFIRFSTSKGSTVASFPLWGDPGAATAPGETSDMANTTMSDTEVSATAAEVGIRFDITDLAKETHPDKNLYGTVAQIAAASVNEKWETDVAALVDDYTNVTTAASTLTPVDVLAAVSALEQRDVPGSYVGYFDPKQTGELRQEIATTTASYEVGRDGELIKPFADSGWFGTFMGLPIWQTSLVVTTSGLVGGAVFASQQTIGCHEVWGLRAETQRDASSRLLEIMATQAYGFGEITDTRGQTVKSVA